MRRHGWIWMLLPGIAMLAGCGDPVVTLPAALEVTFLPLDGARDQEPDVAVEIFFSGEVDPQSVDADTVRLEQADWDPAGQACGESWTASDLQPAVEADAPRAVRVGTAGDTLELSTCYRIVVTTEVCGTDLGPLPDLGIPGRPGIGAEAVFNTRP